MKERLSALITALPVQRRRELALLLSLMTASALVDSGAVIAFARWLGRLAGPASPGPAFIVFAGLMLVSAVLRILVTYVGQHAGHYGARDLIVAVHRNWLDQPYSFYLQRHSAQMLASADRVEQAVFGYILPLFQALAGVLSIVGVFAALVLIDAGPALAMLTVLGALFAIIGLSVRSILSRRAAAANQAYEERIRAIQDGHGSIREIIIDRGQSAFLNRLDEAASAVATASVVSTTASALPRQLIEAGGIVAAAAMAAVMATDRGGIVAAVPLLGALALAGQRLLPAVQALFQGWAASQSAGPMVDEVMALLRLEPGPELSASPPPPFQSAVSLEGVSFAYPQSGAMAISDVSLTVRRGERLILTGPSGAGKSTLADLIMGLLPPDTGSVRVDEKIVNHRELQRLSSHVAQTPYFPDRTLAEIVAGSRSIELDRLHRALDMAGLSDVVARLCEGVSSRLGEQATRLSGGERQRIALARALYRQAPLLILDEATSAVDDETERDIMAALDRLETDGVTIIILAHRGGLLAGAGRVVRLERGRIVSDSGQVAPRLEHQD